MVAGSVAAVDDRLAPLRAVAGGPFTRAQALGAGISRPEIRRALDGKLWVTLRRGVYAESAALAAAAGDERREHALAVAALVLALDREAVGAGSSAARIWGLDLLSRSPLPLVVATSADGVKGCRRDGYLLRRAMLPPRHRGRRFGVPLTSPARTVIDLARDHGVADGVVAADCALRRGLVTVPGLWEVVHEVNGWPGGDRARRAADLADGRSESALESLSASQ